MLIARPISYPNTGNLIGQWKAHMCFQRISELFGKGKIFPVFCTSSLEAFSVSGPSSQG